MAYERQYYTNGNVLNAEQLNHMEAGIKENSDNVGKLSEDIADLKENGTGTGNGATTAQANSLWAIIQKSAFAQQLTDAEINEFKTSWGIGGEVEPDTPEEPDNPEVTLTSISATYTGGEVAVGTSANSLTGITVTATYSDGSTKTVTDYTLSGTIAEGTNTITVSYGGKTTTFTVIGVSSESTVTYYTITNNLTNVTTDNPLNTIAENSGYIAILTPDTDYEFDLVVVTMGGVDITDIAYSNGVISIEIVTGNVVITASAVEPASEEVTLLKNIAFDGTSYLDTEFVPSDINYKYVIGYKYPKPNPEGNNINCGYWAGVSMRNRTSITESDYMDFVFHTLASKNNYNADKPSTGITEVFAGVNYSLGSGSDKGDGLSSQPYDMPFYGYFANAERSIWLDEGMTVAPTTGYFATLSGTDVISNNAYYDANKMPIQSFWLGRPRVTSSVMTNQYKTIYAGVKFYCFKVYDENDNLLVDMRPAKQGDTIGMYCNVRQKFFAGNGTLTYEELEVA